MEKEGQRGEKQKNRTELGSSSSLNLGPKSHLTHQVGPKKVSLGKGQVDPH